MLSKNKVQSNLAKATSLVWV